MIRHIVIKDWKLLWPMAALVAAIQAGREWAVYGSGLFELSPAAAALMQPLTLAWFIGIAALTAAAVHQDAIPGVDQDWLIRPLRRTDLVLAKLAFLALTISAPMVALNLAHALAMGMPLGASIEAVLAKDAFIFACFIVPVAALASTARNMTELVVIGAALVLTFAASLGLSSFLFGANWCPTCHTGMAWLQHLAQHVGIFLGACAILALQYHRRLSTVARAVAVIGAAALVFLQVPWGTAFAVERWLTRSGDDAAGVALELGHETRSTAALGAGLGAADARRTTQLLMHGHVDQAFDYLRGRTRPGNAVALDIPVRPVGVAADEWVLLDRSQVRLRGADGRLLYRGANAGPSPGLLAPDRAESAMAADATDVTDVTDVTDAADATDATDASGLTYQTIELPQGIYRQAASAGAHLQIDDFLTLVKVRSKERIAALDGELRSAAAGYCATRLDRDAIILSCLALGQTPFCYGVTLFSPDGRHDPEVVTCEPDYRRHWPALIDLLGYYGADLPLQARAGAAPYPVGASDLVGAYLLLRIYGESAHFERTLTLAALSADR